MTETNSLAILTEASKMLAQANTLQKVQEFKNMALTAADFAKRKGMATEIVGSAMGYAFDAERKMGEMLAATERATGGDAQRTRFQDGIESPPTLAALGIKPKDSMDAQMVSKLPEKKYEEKREKLVTGTIKTLGRIHGEIKREEVKEIKIREISKAAKNKIMPKDITLFCCDLTTTKITPGSIDAIVTDPPYGKEYLPLYTKLSEKAALWLRDGGTLAVMIGHTQIMEIMQELSKHLHYQWMFAYFLEGAPTQIKNPLINSRWKPVLWYTKGEKSTGCRMDVFKSDAPDKSLHDWGQSESGMDAIVKCFCRPGDTVLDPFMGAGTTGVIAVRNKMKFTGIELDKKTFKIAEDRIKCEL